MLKKFTLLCFYFIAIFFVEFCFADISMTKWKCAVYPDSSSNSSPHIKNYALIEYNGNKAIKYTYFTSPIDGQFYLLKHHYKFLSMLKNNTNVLVYLYAENSSILAIDTVRHLAAEGSTLLGMMPSDINDKEFVLFNKKHKLTLEQKTGASGTGYYCNIDQNIKLPAWKGELTDHYENI